MAQSIARADSWTPHRAPRRADRPWMQQVVAVGIVAVLLAIWQLWATGRDVASYVLTPSDIAQGVVNFVTSGRLNDELWPSMRRIAIGFAIGGSTGLLIGLTAGVSRVFRNMFDLTQSFLHAIPKIALFPAIAVTLGFTDTSRIVVIALGAFFPSYLNAMNGAAGINPRFMWVARNAGSSRWRTFTAVVVPASLPRALVGLRISLMVSFVLMVATEVIGFADGLGAGVMASYYDADYQMMYAGIVVIAFAGIVSNAALQWLTRALLPGQPAGGGTTDG